MIRTEFAAAIQQVAAERGIAPEIILETLKHAILAAYRKDGGKIEKIEVKIDPGSGEVTLLDETGKDVTPSGFGRIAAQVAKQIILQGVITAEKEAILDDYQKRVGSILSGMLQRREGENWIVDLGRTTGLLPVEEQISSEQYRQNQRLRFYFKEIREVKERKGLILSRTDENLVLGLFEIEVPEVANGAVKIKAIAREPGSRTKVAVSSTQEKVDPIGSCVGQKGVRVQAITQELMGEKIDLIFWHVKPEEFIAASLSPAKVLDVKIDELKKVAKVKVDEEQLSLAIGREGQNARLAAKLTGFRVDIEGVKIEKEKAPSVEKMEAKTKPVNSDAKSQTQSQAKQTA